MFEPIEGEGVELHAVLNLSGMPLMVESTCFGTSCRMHVPPIATAREIFNEPENIRSQLKSELDGMPQLRDFLSRYLQKGHPVVAVLHPHLTNFRLVECLAEQLVEWAGGFQNIGSTELVMTTTVNSSEYGSAPPIAKTQRAALLNVSVRGQGVMTPQMRVVTPLLESGIESEDRDAVYGATQQSLPTQGDMLMHAARAVAAREGLFVVHAGRGVPQQGLLFGQEDRLSPVTEAVANWAHEVLGCRWPNVLSFERQIRPVNVS